MPKDAGRAFAPRQCWRDRHQEQQCDTDRHGEGIEVRGADLDDVARYRLDEERKDGSGKHDDGKGTEEEVVRQEGALARDRGVNAPSRAELVASPTDEDDRAEDNRAEQRQQCRANAGVRKGVDRVDEPGSGEERGKDGQAERADQERKVPDPKQPAALLDHYRVQIRGGGDPRQQCGVLNGIPAPEPSPAEHLVRPPGSEHDPERQERKGDDRVPPSLDQPPLPHSAGDQGRYGERERDGEANEAEIQENWMHRNEHVVLQQGIWSRTINGNGPDRRRERVRRTEHQCKEKDRDREADEHRPRHDRVTGSAAISPTDKGQIAGKYQAP